MATQNPATLPPISKLMSWVSALIKDDTEAATNILEEASCLEKRMYFDGQLIERNTKKSKCDDPEITETKYCPEKAW